MKHNKDRRAIGNLYTTLIQEKQNAEHETQKREVRSSDDLVVGDSVKVTLSSGTTDWSTGKVTRPEVTAVGKIIKIADTEQSVHAGDIAKEYTVKYKNSLTGRIETNRFRHVMPA